MMDTLRHITRSLSSLSAAQAASVLAVLVPVVGLAVRDYRQWYALGPGGLPHNWKGWLVQSILRLFCTRDTRSLAYYDTYLSSSGIEKCSFLPEHDLPARTGPRPRVGAWAAPHRQLESVASADMRSLVAKDIKALGSHPQLETGPSKTEGGCPALYLRDHTARHPVYKRVPTELFHMHESDGSMHCILSAADAKLVLGRGWGERHGLTGKFGFPPGYTLIFAPRNKLEQAVVRKIAQAAVQYGLDGEMGDPKQLERLLEDS